MSTATFPIATSAKGGKHLTVVLDNEAGGIAVLKVGHRGRPVKRGSPRLSL
jgi:hypothetical protein